MSGYYDFYQRVNSANGSNLATKLQNSTINVINKTFSDAPNYMTGTLNGASIDFRYTKGKNDKDEYSDRVFEFRPNQKVDRGDMIVSNGNTWLLVDTNFINELTPSANVLLCNDSLNWKDANNNNFSCPCAVIGNKTTRNVIQEDHGDINLPKSYIHVHAQLNDNTKSIKYRERFLFGGHAFEVTGIDSASFVYQGKGIIVFTMFSTPTKDKDDTTNQVASNESLQYKPQPTLEGNLWA